LETLSENRSQFAPTPDRSDEIQYQIQQLAGRDWQLWSIGVLVMLVLVTGMLAVFFPNIFSDRKIIVVEQHFLPQLLFGLITLIILVNIYLMEQRRSLNATRAALIRELVFNQRLENMSLFDPLTQLFNRRALDEMVQREITRVSRIGSSLTFLLFDIDGFRSINTQFGHQAGDKLLVEVAQLLRNNFRGGDVLFRLGGDEFLVVMPDTSETQVDPALVRLQKSVDTWNASRRRDYDLSLSWGLAGYVVGLSQEDILRHAERKLYQRKHKMVPLF
jgi:diguanylate cyclase (GGDEF)-like protein